MTSPSNDNARPLVGRVALVTGASRGIGAAVALRLAEAGAHIIAVARTTGGLEALDDRIKALGSTATLVPFDIKDGAAIDRLGAAVMERWKKLDILVGNAGMLGMLGPIGHMKPKMWDDVLAVNLTANWRLIRSFDPLLRASDAGRVIFVTSSVGREPRAYWGAYAVSKAALEHMARIYAAEVAKTNVRVNLVNPGGTRTAMRAQAMPGEDPQTVKAPEEVADLFLKLALPSCTAHGELFEYGKR